MNEVIEKCVYDLSTSEVLALMLTENTGRHFLDSGGAYGRNYAANKDVDFDASDRATVSFTSIADNKDWWINFEVSLYHFLNDRLDYVSKLQRALDKFADDIENDVSRRGASAIAFKDAVAEHNLDDDSNWFELVEGFITYLENLGYVYEKKETTNTYNGESVLSQVMQFNQFTVQTDDETNDIYQLEDAEYFIVFVHGGCDVRGGYTEPKIFTCAEDSGLYESMTNTIHCDNPDCRATWDIQYNTIEFIQCELNTPYVMPLYKVENNIVVDDKNLNDYTANELQLPDNSSFENAVCPICKKGRLTASFFG